MVTVSMGSKKKQYRSVKEFAAAHGLPYMTAYMRLRFGKKPASVAKQPVRKYRKGMH